jgi:L-rhamnose mutarotase
MPLFNLSLKMKNACKINILLMLSVLLAGCAVSEPPQRFAWVTGLKADQAARYEYLHAHVWPGVNRTIKECHIQNFSIHECSLNGRLYLFAYLEYTGTNFDTDMNKMAADPLTRSWWKQTDPCQTPLPDAAAKGKIWSDTKEVYFLP